MDISHKGKRTFLRLDRGKWIDVQIEELKITNMFRVIEGVERQPFVVDGKHTEFVVMDDPYLNEEGTWAVKAVFLPDNSYSIECI